MSIKNCCCHMGAARDDEWPEFQCQNCEVHIELVTADGQCRRHRKEDETK